MAQATEQAGEIRALRVLTLDGGGAKGFYTLGVLKEIEAMLGVPPLPEIRSGFRDQHRCNHRFPDCSRPQRRLHPRAVPHARTHRDVAKERSNKVNGLEKTGR